MKKLLCVFMVFLAGSVFASEPWKEFVCQEGKCKVSFPMHPQHVKERMFLPTAGAWIEYDVYLSALQKSALFVLMIAEYPVKIAEEQVNSCLQSFLKGMVGKSGTNQLIFADLTEVGGRKALEFFLEANKSFFRGKIFLADNKLFLLAVECKEPKESENLYGTFSESFSYAKKP